MVISGVYGDTTWANVMYLKTEGFEAAELGDLNELADDVIGEISSNNFYGFQSNELNVTALRLNLHQAVGVFLDTTRGADISGTNDGGVTPADTAVVISWSTTIHRRGGKPRTYLAGVDATEMATEKHIDISTRNQLAARANDFISGVDALTTDPFTDVKVGTVLFSEANAWLTPPEFRRFLGAHVHGRFGTQRRRLGDWVA